jgi:septal ring-binding cell division protein DamX
MNLQEAKNLILQHAGQFYTYWLKKLNGKPFYVGTGK